MSYIVIILKCILIYVYLIILLRFLGKKEFSQLSIFDFVVFLIISELLILYFDEGIMGLLQSVVSTFTLVAVDKVCSYYALKNKKIRDVIDGKPTYIIFNGKVNQEAMYRLRYNIDSLCQHLRTLQVESIDQVQFAVLETNGDLSVFLKKDVTVAHLEPVISDGIIMNNVLDSLELDQKWLFSALAKVHVQDYKDVFYCVIKKDLGLFVVMKQGFKNHKST